ncbi:MAG: phytanoyl-CoA dioxygenase family protein [Planctomycetota bacterium]|nr:phytanoyl-CoA dioxygenase family protein [Planctomycetota bacterium]
MSFRIDETLHWTDHYVEHGIAVIRGAVDDTFCERALKEVSSLIGADISSPEDLAEKLNGKSHVPYNPGTANMQVLPEIYDQPGIRSMIDTMFGDAGAWNGERSFQLFVSPFDPEAEPKLSGQGHIDFVKCPIPALGSGFMFQVSLVRSEPFSGNITIYPGTHKIVQKLVIDDPEWRYPTNMDMVPVVEPYEFVAEPGDVMLFHHLVLHDGNANHAANRSPRVVIHAQALHRHWLPQSYGDLTNCSPWERSLSQNGEWRPPWNEQKRIEDFRAQRKK